MKRFSFSYILTGLLLGVALAAHAQPSTGGPQPQPAATAVPLDGGASLLLAGGAAYGLRLLKRSKSAK